MIKWLGSFICLFKGHKFETAKQYLLPARQCKRCGLRQVKLPNTGIHKPGWVLSKSK